MPLSFACHMKRLGLAPSGQNYLDKRSAAVCVMLTLVFGKLLPDNVTGLWLSTKCLSRVASKAGK